MSDLDFDGDLAHNVDAAEHNVNVESFDDSALHVWPFAHAPAWAREELKTERRFVAFIPVQLRSVFPPPYAMFPQRSTVVELGDMSNLVGFDAWPVPTFDL